MINEIINEINIKKVIILGFGREGRSTYKFIRKYLPNKKLYIGDIQDLKKFILSAAQFIAADYDADEALSFTSSN